MLLLSRFVIQGHSMEPTLSQGQTVLVSSIPYFFLKPKVGDIVVIRHSGNPPAGGASRISYHGWRFWSPPRFALSPQNDGEDNKYLIKRIIKIDPSADGDKYFVSGDNKKDSLDSRKFGWISRRVILGKVVYF